MQAIEALTIWLSVWLYGIAFVTYLAGFIFGKEIWIRYGRHIVFAGLSAHTLSLGIRWYATGHPPVKGVYENSMLGGWFITAVYAAAARRNKRLDVVGVAVLPFVLLMIGNGIMKSSAHTELTPPYKSNWLWLHVFFAWVAYGAFCVGAGLGALYLLKEKRGDSGFFANVPSLRDIDNVTMKVIMFGFIALTVEIGAGAIWAYGLWGRYWGWDPIETWSLITWLTYGTYIHLGTTLGWKGRRMAWLAILAIISTFITFGGVGYLGGIHTTIL